MVKGEEGDIYILPAAIERDHLEWERNDMTFREHARIPHFGLTNMPENSGCLLTSPCHLRPGHGQPEQGRCDLVMFYGSDQNSQSWWRRTCVITRIWDGTCPIDGSGTYWTHGHLQASSFPAAQSAGTPRAKRAFRHYNRTLVHQDLQNGRRQYCFDMWRATCPLSS